MSSPSCLTCRHSEPCDLEGGNDVSLECRRYPPTTHIINGEPMMLFPQVYEGDYCGEYQEETT